jgi:hypothetical protein
MARRTLLVAPLVGSTVAFAVGVSIERASADTPTEPAHAAESGEAGESSAEHAAEETPQSDEGGSETFLGIDYEAVRFVALAAALSLALAAAAWLRPHWAALLAAIAVAMVAFAALDVREFLHQIDESNGGLAILAAVVAVSHLAAAAVAALMRSSTEPAGASPLALPARCGH